MIEDTVEKSRYYKLTKNCVECTSCGDIISSSYTHNFVRCKCGKTFTDGGLEYVRRSLNCIDRSEYRRYTIDELYAEIEYMSRSEFYSTSYTRSSIKAAKSCLLDWYRIG